MIYKNQSNLTMFLLSLTIILALGYIVEVNKIQDKEIRLREERIRLKELTLEYQRALTTVSLAPGDEELSRLKEEFRFDEVDGFTLLEPREAQFSFNPKTYE